MAFGNAAQDAAGAALEQRKRVDTCAVSRKGTRGAALRPRTCAAASSWLLLLRCALAVALVHAARALAPPLVVKPFYVGTSRASWLHAARTAIAALVLAVSLSRAAVQAVAFSGRSEKLPLCRRRYHHQAGSRPAACGARPAATDSAFSKPTAAQTYCVGRPCRCPWARIATLPSTLHRLRLDGLAAILRLLYSLRLHGLDARSTAQMTRWAPECAG